VPQQIIEQRHKLSSISGVVTQAAFSFINWIIPKIRHLSRALVFVSLQSSYSFLVFGIRMIAKSVSRFSSVLLE
jgi:hypothetical protein